MFVWPNDEYAREALVSSTMVIAVPATAAFLIQFVTPWEAPQPRRGHKLRLPCT